MHAMINPCFNDTADQGFQLYLSGILHADIGFGLMASAVNLILEDREHVLKLAKGCPILFSAKTNAIAYNLSEAISFMKSGLSLLSPNTHLHQDLPELYRILEVSVEMVEAGVEAWNDCIESDYESAEEISILISLTSQGLQGLKIAVASTWLKEEESANDTHDIKSFD